MFTLASPHNRCKHLKPCALRQPHNLVDNLVNRLLPDFPATLRAMYDSHSGIEKSHIIIYLCDSPDCGTWIAVGRLLVNGNRR